MRNGNGKNNRDCKMNQYSRMAFYAMRDKVICETIGYILFENKDAIVICNTQNTESQVCGIIRIPKGCIKERKAVK